MTPETNNSSNEILKDNDLRFMARAFELAQEAEKHNEIPVGAVVVVDGKIIGEGFNQSIMP